MTASKGVASDAVRVARDGRRREQLRHERLPAGRVRRRLRVRLLRPAAGEGGALLEAGRAKEPGRRGSTVLNVSPLIVRLTF